MSDERSTKTYNTMPTDSNFTLEYPIFEALLNTSETTVCQYLQHHLPECSSIDEWLNEREVLIDKVKADGSSLLQAGQTLSILLSAHFEQQVNKQWHIIWQNPEILALFKPAPLAVSRTTRNLHDTLVGLVRRQTPYCKAQLLHRLDIETSGLILLAKDQPSDVKWKKNLSTLIEKKIYHAIVKGVPQWQEYLCENQLAERTDSAIRCKMYVVDETAASSDYRKPKQCKSIFKLLKSQGQYSLIECQIFTGRKHQIRAQLAALGLPIVGDKIYSEEGKYFLKRLALENGLSAEDYRQLGAKNHLLRAVELHLRLADDQPLTKLYSPSFAQDLHAELYPASDEKRTS